MKKFFDIKDCVLYHGDAVECVESLSDKIQAVITRAG